LYGSPDLHEEFKTAVNNWEYPVEGKHLKGRLAPYVSEVKVYDVRLPKDMIKPFLRDIKAKPLSILKDHLNNLANKNKTGKNRLINMLFWLVMKFNPLKQLEKSKDPPKDYKLGSWHNAYLLGMIEDDINKNALTGEKREIL